MPHRVSTNGSASQGFLEIAASKVQTVSSTAAVTAVEVNVLNLLVYAPGAMATSSCKVRFEYVLHQSSGNLYSHGGSIVVLVRRASGVLAVVGTASQREAIGSANAPTVSCDVSGDLVRLRIAPFDATSTTIWAVADVVGVQA